MRQPVYEIIYCPKCRKGNTVSQRDAWMTYLANTIVTCGRCGHEWDYHDPDDKCKKPSN